MFSFQIVDRIRRQSLWASCELCSHRRRRVCIGLKRQQSSAAYDAIRKMAGSYGKELEPHQAFLAFISKAIERLFPAAKSTY